MKCVNATKFHRKSGGAKPTCPGVPRRDLDLRGPFLERFCKLQISFADPLAINRKIAS